MTFRVSLAVACCCIGWVARPLHAIEPTPAKSDDALLVIVASQVHSRTKCHETIVLRHSGDKITWSATSTLPRILRRYSGEVADTGIRLSDVFEKTQHAATAGKEDRADSEPLTVPTYTVLLIGEQGTTSSAVLDVTQRRTLRTLLEPIFTDIKRHGPFLKPNIMLELLLDDDAPQAVTLPRRAP